MRNTLNPNWNEIFHFAWPSAALQAKGAAGVANGQYQFFACIYLRCLGFGPIIVSDNWSGCTLQHALWSLTASMKIRSDGTSWAGRRLILTRSGH